EQPEPIVRLRPGLPQELTDLVDRCLTKRADDRPPGLGGVAEALRRLLDTADAPPFTAAATPIDSTAPSTDSAAQLTPPASVSGPAARSPAPAWAGGGGAKVAFPESPTPDGPAPGAPVEALPTLATPPAVAPRRVWLVGLSAVAALSAALWGFGILTSGPLPDTARQQEADSEEAREPTAYDHFLAARTLLDRYDLEGQVDQAIEVLGLALARDREHAAAHALLAEAYCRKFVIEGSDPMWLDHALGHARRGVQLGSFLAVTHRALARVHLLRGNPSEAASALDRAELLEPLHPAASILRGVTAEELGRPEDGERALRRAVELGPEDREAHDSLGSLLFRLGRFAEAEQSFRKSVELAPDSYIGHRNLAGALQMQGRYTEAASALQRSLEIRPTASSYSNLGTLHFYAGLYADAVHAYEQAIELGASHYLIWGNLGDAHRFVPGQREEAATAYRRAVQLARERLRRAEAEGGSSAAASEEATLRSRVALFLVKAGEKQQALDELELLSFDDAGPALLLRALTVRELAGERDAALGLLERLVDAGYPTEALGEDPELVGLRRDSRYHRILARASELRLDPG
ncbi:MAG: tetratricopeptide repeat protein, partial [Holophagales bacterium]|nr:tetratricopeptide repeat protein [Holophagales bacterium]